MTKSTTPPKFFLTAKPNFSLLPVHHPLGM